MAERDAPGSPGGDDQSDSLDKLKTALESADNESMDEGTTARFDIHWDPVTDAGGPPPADTEASENRASDNGSGFQFDLGGALARLGEPAAPSAPRPPAEPGPTEPEPPAAPTPPPTADDPLSSLRGLIDDSAQVQRPDSRAAPHTAPPPAAPAPAAPAPAPVAPVTPPAAPASSVAPEAPAPPAEPVPDIVEATMAELPVRPKGVPRGSVFADVEAETPAPRLPGTPDARSAPGTPQLPDAVAPVPIAQSSPDGNVAPPPTGVVPTLPDAPAVASPVVTEVHETARTTSDVHALRSAQLRADRQMRKSKLFGRSLLAFLAIAAFIAVGLIFGRSYLFQTEWGAELTPVVDEIQLERGADFDHTVPLTVQTADEYASTVLAATIGSDWAGDLPIWRAAGLAAGDATTATVAAELAQRFPVVYDPDTDTIYQLADADAARVEDELRIVLDDIFDLQSGAVIATRSSSEEPQFTGVSSSSYVAQRAVDVLASGGRSPIATGDDDSTESALTLPLPIQYELDAIDLLGEAVLSGANVDPSSAARGLPYPEGLATVLDDLPTRTASGLLRPGERAIGDAVALGVDDWSLVWGAYLPPSTVDRLSEDVIADSFRPIDRNGTTCFIGVFQTATQAEGTQVFSAMLSWARDAPLDSQALATQLGTTRVQLESCDADILANGPVEASTVDDLITRQIDRLAR